MMMTYLALVRALAILAGAIFVATTVGITLDVALRACCTSAIVGLTDLTEYGLASATFLAAPWVLMKGAHVSVDIVTMTLSDRWRRHVSRLVNTLGAAISAILFWYMAKALMIAFERGSMVRGILVVPEWLTLLAPALCCGLLTAGFLLLLRHGSLSRAEPTGF